MKEKLLKLVPVIVLIVAFIDTNYDLLQSVGVPVKFIDAFKLIGLIIVSFSPKVSVLGFLSKEGDPDPNEDIGGGGIKNPPKP